MAGGYFRVDGADLETGEESYLVLQAVSLAEAEKVARKQGLLISAVRVASPADWGVAKTAKPVVEPPTITFEPRESPTAPASSNGSALQTTSEADEAIQLATGSEVSDEPDAEPLLTLSDADEQGIPEPQAIDDSSDSLQSVEVAPLPGANEPQHASATALAASPHASADDAPSLGSLEDDTEAADDIISSNVSEIAPPTPVAAPADFASASASSTDVSIKADSAVAESSRDENAEAASVFSDEPRVIAAPANPRTSIFADAVLSEENAESAIAASIPPGEQALTASDATGSDVAGSSSEPSDEIPTSTSASEWSELPPGDSQAQSSDAGMAADAPVEPSSPRSADSDAPAKREQADSVAPAEAPARKSPAPITVRPVRKASDESIAAPTVSVTAKPVLIPKMILAENLRRVGQAKGSSARPASGSRVPPTARPTPPPPKAVIKDITLIAANDVNEPLAIEPGAKPGTSPRPVTATVVSRRSGRNSPAGRRSQQPVPPTRIPPPGQPALGVQVEARSSSAGLSAVAELSPQRPAPDQASRLEQVVADMDVARSANHASAKREMLADAQRAAVAAPATQELYPDQSTADMLLSPADAPAAVDTLTAESTATVEPMFEAAPRAEVEVEAEMPIAVPAPSGRLAGKTQVKPKASPATGAAPWFLFVLCPIATLLTLGGIALIAVSQFTSVPTAAVELEKLDFSLKMLAEAFVGGISMLAGLLLFVFGAILNLSHTIRGQNAK